MKLQGICTPICTVFNQSDNTIDENKIRQQVDTLIDAGIHIIAACGGTGEFSFLTREERLSVTEIIAHQISGRCQFIVHTSAVMTEETIEYSKHAEDLGADCLLVLPPYFEGPNLDGVYEHYENVANAVSTPIMAYNIPVHTGIDLTPEFCVRLKSIESIHYLKDSTSDFVRMQELIDEQINVFVGGEPVMFHSLLAGAAGCFWGTSNAIPRQAVELYNLVNSGDYQNARDLWSKIYGLNNFIWNHPFNPSVKAAARLLGNDLGECRRPVQPLSAEDFKQLESITSQFSAYS